jgi:hypothetical protein
LKFRQIDSIRDHHAFPRRYCLQPHKAIGRRAANRGGSQAQAIGEPVGQHARPSTFVHIVYCRENYSSRSQYLQQPRDKIGVKAVAMHQVRLEILEKSPSPQQPTQHA